MTTLKKSSTTHKEKQPSHEEHTVDEQRMLTTFGRRLTQVLDSHGYGTVMAHRCAEFARQLGVSPAGVRKWLVGDGMPSSAMLKTIAEKMAVSIDWLFDVSPPISQFAPDEGGRSIPVYSVAKSFDGDMLGVPRNAFSRSGAMAVTRTPMFVCPDNAHVCLVECWVDSPGLGIQRGDLLLAETALHSIADGQVYLLRTGKGATFIRRATIELNEAVTFLTIEQGGMVQRYSASQIIYAGSFDENGTNRLVTILGRVIGTCRLRY